MQDQNISPGINLDQATLLASRVFAAFFLFWVVEDITELPRELYTVMHYLHQATLLDSSPFEAVRSSYFLGDCVMYLLGNILHIALWLLAAGWFYRCGPRIRTFFNAAAKEPPTEDSQATPAPSA